MQSSEMRVLGLEKLAGMPGEVTGSTFSMHWATCQVEGKELREQIFLGAEAVGDEDGGV